MIGFHASTMKVVPSHTIKLLCKGEEVQSNVLELFAVDDKFFSSISDIFRQVKALSYLNNSLLFIVDFHVMALCCMFH